MIMLDGVSKVYRTRTGRKIVLDNVNATFGAGHNFGFGVTPEYRSPSALVARFTVPSPATRMSPSSLGSMERGSAAPSIMSRRSPSSENISRCR